MIKMVAFDFDGTIADTIPLCMEAFKKAMLPYTGFALSENEIIQTFGLNEIGMVKAIVKDDWESALRDFYFYFEKIHDSCKAPFPQIYDLMKYLKGKNILVPLITGRGQKSCDISLKKLELDNCFSDVMVGDETRNNKAESISKLQKKYAIKNEEFYYVGDAVSDITACREVGVICLSAAWSESADEETLKKTNPDYTFDNVFSLKKFLESLF